MPVGSKFDADRAGYTRRGSAGIRRRGSETTGA